MVGSNTEENTLQTVLRCLGRKPGSHAVSASDDCSRVEWESDFMGADVDHNSSSQYSGFVNPALEPFDPGTKQSNADQLEREDEIVWPCAAVVTQCWRYSEGPVHQEIETVLWMLLERLGVMGCIWTASELSAISSPASCFPKTSEWFGHVINYIYFNSLWHSSFLYVDFHF